MISINSELPDSWVLALNKNKIMIMAKNHDTIPELLFTYQGKLRAYECRVIDRELKSIGATLTNNHLGFWNKISGTWDSSGVWGSFNGTYQVGRKVLRMDNIRPTRTGG